MVIHHASDYTGCVIRVKCTEYQVARKCGLDGHPGGLGVSYFSDHDSVGILSQDTATLPSTS